MVRGIMLTDEELGILEELLRQELGNTRSEYRRTRNPDFRSGIQHRMKLERHILQTIEQAR